MLMIDDPSSRRLLTRIVGKLTADTTLREDLMQEALIHLWLLEERRPAQTPSWYFQSCQFHLQNYITSGRSVDSPKRRSRRITFSDGRDDLDTLMARPETDGAELGLVSARDIITLLSKRLAPRERAILGYLAEGLGAREIAKRMKVTHPTVIKHRRKIAALALKLGVDPLPQPNNHKNNRRADERSLRR